MRGTLDHGSTNPAQTASGCRSSEEDLQFASPTTGQVRSGLIQLIWPKGRSSDGKSMLLLYGAIPVDCHQSVKNRPNAHLTHNHASPNGFPFLVAGVCVFVSKWFCSQNIALFNPSVCQSWPISTVGERLMIVLRHRGSRPADATASPTFGHGPETGFSASVRNHNWARTSLHPVAGIPTTVSTSAAVTLCNTEVWCAVCVRVQWKRLVCRNSPTETRFGFDPRSRLVSMVMRSSAGHARAWARTGITC